MNGFQLTPRLKRLKLGGMLQTLELRVDQAHQEKLGHLEFLELLLEDEIGRRQNKALAHRLARARFDEPHTIADFDFAFNPKIPSAQIRDLASCAFIARKESVLLVGPVGVGKTHLAQSIGHAACMQGRSVLFEKTSRLLADLGAGHLDGTWERRLRRYLAPDLLVCDDFGLRAFLGLSDTLRPGYQGIRLTYRVTADAPRAQLEELCEYVQKTSPVLDIVRNPVPVTITLAD